MSITEERPAPLSDRPIDAPTPRRLWHYCCSHSVAGIIGDGGLLKPNPYAGEQPLSSALAKREGYSGPVITLPVIWLTDIDVREWEDAAFIGLESPFVECNRVQYRFRVPKTDTVQWWPTWADDHLAEHDVSDEFRELLEYACLSDRWWVSEIPLPGCRYDERYKGPKKERARWMT